MVFTHIDLLPPIVKAALPSKEKKERWRQAFNKAWVRTQNYEGSMSKAFELFKSDPECRYFEGWLSVDGIDRQGDVMDQKALHQALKKFIDRGGTLVDTHTNRVLGALYSVELRKFDDRYEGNYGKGVLYHGEPYYDHVWNEIKKGEKNSFSIGGFALNYNEECNGWSCHRKVTDESIHELSLCKTPAHPEANMTAFNQLAKAVGSNDLEKPPVDFEIEAIGGEELVKAAKQRYKDDAWALKVIERRANQILDAVHRLTASFDDDEAAIEPLNKVGTVEGACRHHRQHHHHMTDKCTGLALDVDDDDDRDEEKDDVRQPKEEKRRPLDYRPVAYVDEEKKKREHERADTYVHKHSGVRRANDKKAREMAAKVREMMPADLPSDAKRCYERAIRILEDNSGLPVEKRLSIINSGAKSACEKRTAIKISARLRG